MVKKKPHQSLSLTLTKTPLLLITKYRKQFAILHIFLMLRLMNRKKYVLQTYTRLYLCWRIQPYHKRCAHVTWQSTLNCRTTASSDLRSTCILVTTTCITFVVMTAVSIRIRVFCDVTPCSLESIYRTWCWYSFNVHIHFITWGPRAEERGINRNIYYYYYLLYLHYKNYVVNALKNYSCLLEEFTIVQRT
jgi:hypothetical protein